MEILLSTISAGQMRHYPGRGFIPGHQLCSTTDWPADRIRQSDAQRLTEHGSIALHHSLGQQPFYRSL